jgi:hypothetical protein
VRKNKNDIFAPYQLLYSLSRMVSFLITTIIDIVAKLPLLNSTDSRLGLMIATSLILSSSSSGVSI